jgi:hypothetical protein
VTRRIEPRRLEPRRLELRRLVPGAILTATALLLLLVGTPLVDGALNGRLTNTNDTAATTGYFTCTAAAQGSSGTGSYSTWPLNETGGTTANDVSGNGHNGTYSIIGVTYGTAGPCPRDGARAVTFDGLTGSVYDPTGVALTATSAQSDEVYFKTTTAAGGALITSDSSTIELLGTCDRVTYMNAAGQVVFGVMEGSAVHTIVSPLSYNDGNWHLVDGVYSPTAGTALYVDGTLVASGPSYTTADAITSYTRLASGQLTGWPNSSILPLPSYWQGSEAFASIYHYALSAAQVTAHYAASRAH